MKNLVTGILALAALAMFATVDLRGQTTCTKGSIETLLTGCLTQY